MEQQADDQKHIDNDDKADNCSHGFCDFKIGQPRNAGCDMNDNQKQNNNCDNLTNLAVRIQYTKNPEQAWSWLTLIGDIVPLKYET